MVKDIRELAIFKPESELLEFLGDFDLDRGSVRFWQLEWSHVQVWICCNPLRLVGFEFQRLLTKAKIEVHDDFADELLALREYAVVVSLDIQELLAILLHQNSYTGNHDVERLRTELVTLCHT